MSWVTASAGQGKREHCVKATVENPRGSAEKLSPKENVKGADTVLSGSVRAAKGFSEGKPEVLQPRVCPRKIQREPSHCPAAQCRQTRHSPEGTVISLCPKDFQKLLRLPK